MRRINNSTSSASSVIYSLSPSDQLVQPMVSIESPSVTRTSTAMGRMSIRRDKNTENAIYGYVRALRSLGRKTVDTVEIAEALFLPLNKVHNAIEALKKKGVKVL